MVKIELLDALSKPTDQFPLPVYVNKAGTRAYAVYEVTAANALAAELFDISSGKWVSIATYNTDATFIAVDDGNVNEDFTTFSIVEDDQAGSVRISLLQANLNTATLDVVASQTFSPVITNGFTTLGGTFVGKNKVILTGVTTNSSPNQRSTLWLLKRNGATLDTLDTLESERVYTTSGVYIKKEKSLVITTSQGVLDFNDLVDNWLPKHRVVQIKIHHNKLNEVDSAPLPQGAFNISSTDSKVLVGTSLALNPNEVSIPIHTAFNQSALKKSDAELRIYEVKDCELKLICAKDVDASVGGLALNPQEDALFVAYAVSPYSDFGPGVMQTSSYKHCKLCNKSFPIPLSGPIVSFAFDDSGRVLAVGAPSNQIDNNLLLFRVKA